MSRTWQSDAPPHDDRAHVDRPGRGGRAPRSPSASDYSQCLAVMYHYVQDRAPRAYRGVVALGVRDFERQIDALCREFEPVDWPCVHRWLQGDHSLPHRAFLLTFDDGLADHAHTVAPMLEKRGLRGTFFVSSGPLMEKRAVAAHVIHVLMEMMSPEDLWERIQRWHVDHLGLMMEWTPADSAEAERIYHYESAPTAKLKHCLHGVMSPETRNDMLDNLLAGAVGGAGISMMDWYMSESEIRELHARGHTIGGHGHSHERLGRMTPDDQRSDLASYLAWHRRVLGAGAVPLSYPFGSYSEATAKVAQEAGFAAGFTTRMDWIRATDDTQELPRVDTIRIGDFTGAGEG